MSKVVQLRASDDKTAPATRRKFEWLRSMVRDPNVSATAYRLACLLMWEYRNEAKGGECYPGLTTLAEDLNVNEKTIRRAIAELVDEGYLRVERRGKRASNLYWPMFGDRTSMSTRNDDDRTNMSEVIGHSQGQKCPGNHGEQWLEINEGGLQPPGRQCSTVEVSRGSRLDGAPPSQAENQKPQTFRVGGWRRNANGDHYEVLAVDVEAHTVTVRFTETGIEQTTNAPAGAVLIPSADDLDDEIPF